MGENTAIQWTNRTYNPWQGCTKVSPGCAHCYMFSEKTRYGQDPATVVRSKDPTFYAPLKWKDPALVFTCSWSDFFHVDADPWRAEAWGIIRQTPHLTYQILTKRPERIAACLPADWGTGWPNVWLGTSVENQRWATRIDALLAVPAAVRFLSCEPLLGPLDLTPWLWEEAGPAWVGRNVAEPGLDWIIIGGESGHKARPMMLGWARDLVRQCRAAGVAVFVKQLGEVLARAWDCKDRKGGVMEEWPLDIQVREFPQARVPA